MHAPVLERPIHDPRPEDTFNGFAIPAQQTAAQTAEQPWWNTTGEYGTQWQPDWYQQATAKEQATAERPTLDLIRPYVTSGPAIGRVAMRVQYLPKPEEPASAEDIKTDIWDWRTDPNWQGATAYKRLTEHHIPARPGFTDRDEPPVNMKSERRRVLAWLAAGTLAVGALVASRYWDTIQQYTQIRGK
jgi:hypothetical protein